MKAFDDTSLTLKRPSAEKKKKKKERKKKKDSKERKKTKKSINEHREQDQPSLEEAGSCSQVLSQ